MTDQQITVFQKYLELGISYGAKLLVAIIIYFVGRWIARFVTDLLKKALSRSKMDDNIVQYIGNLVYAILLIFVILAAIAKLGVQTASFVAIMGAATLAIGMALQGTLGNFSSGVMLMIFKPFRLGDTISAGGVEGIVQDIGIFSTVIVPSDGRKVIVPNGALAGGTIVNFSGMPQRRVELSIGVPGNTNIQQVQDIMREILASEEAVIKDPAPSVIITATDAGSIVFGVYAPVKTEDYGKVHASLLEKIKLVLTEKGIWS